MCVGLTRSWDLPSFAKTKQTKLTKKKTTYPSELLSSSSSSSTYQAMKSVLDFTSTSTAEVGDAASGGDERAFEI